ncbi:MAG: glycosyltransferase [Solirubrobacterales bacterium]|nr:glycosyltransferase [Solirubrobacterales bacterium]
MSLGGQIVPAAQLVAPVAVRTLDLGAPVSDLRVRRGDRRPPYRSLLVVAHLGGDPIGTAAFSLREGAQPSGDQLAEGLVWRFAAEVCEAHTRRDHALARKIPLLAAPPTLDRRGFPPRALPAVSVVVATCGNPPALERCVSSILACDYEEFEVIVVDNRPHAADTEAMLAERFPGDGRLRYVEEGRRGASLARNAGLACAAHEVVAFTDDDVVVDRGWIRAGVEALRRADDVGCVTGLILPLELETDSQVLLEQFAGFCKGFRRRTFRHPESRADIPFFPYAPGVIGSGANTVLWTDVARELGGFDTDLGPGTPTTGGEDLDLYIRLLRAGHAVSYEPRAIVWHQHPDGSARLRRQVYRYGVGLGAVLAKQLLVGSDRRGFVRAVPAGIRYARDPGSRKNAGKPPDYPRRLEWLERLGMLVGPAAYGFSFLATRARRLVSRGLPVPRPRQVRAREVAPGQDGIVLVTAVTCVAAALSVALNLPVAVRMAAVLAFLCLAPGGAFLTAVRGRGEAGLIVGISLGATAVLAQTMLWLGAWRPRAFLYGLCGLCLVAVAPGIARLLAPRAATAGARAALRRARLAARHVTPEAHTHAALIIVALLAWTESLLGAHLNRIGGLGLLQAMPATYFLAFALLLVGFAIAASSGGLDPRVLGLYILALIVVLHATTAILYDEPRYAWVYKHLGVINLIASTGAADRNVDIYNNWPSFFAANAWLSKTSGVGSIDYAGWAQLFFNLVGAAAVRFALRGVTRDERLLWTATLFFVLGNWVGQDYLAPQAFGFVLSLVVIGLFLRCGPRAAHRWRRRAASGRRWLAPRLPDDELAPAPLGPRAALLGGAACVVAVVTSHQLSPVFLILSVGTLALFRRWIRYPGPLERPLAEGRSTSRPSRSGRFLTQAGPIRVRAAGPGGQRVLVEVLGAERTGSRRAPAPWLGRAPSGRLGRPLRRRARHAVARRDDRDLPGVGVVVAMLAVEVWWVALAWPFLHAHFGLIEPSPGKVPGRNVGAALPGAALIFYAPAAVMASIAVLALIGFARRLRGGKRDLVPACLIVAPLLGVALQSYGGEGPFRAYLFALPWLGLLAAFACVQRSSPIGEAQLSFRRLAAVTPVIGAFLLLAYFGQELANRIPADDVAASTWYEQHAPPGSMRIDLAPNAPSRLTARYPLVSLADPPSLLEQPGFAGHLLGPVDVARLERLIRQQHARPAYVVLSIAQEGYGRLNGMLPGGSVRSFVLALGRSGAFRLVYTRPTDWVFKYSPPVERRTRP